MRCFFLKKNLGLEVFRTDELVFVERMDNEMSNLQSKLSRRLGRGVFSSFFCFLDRSWSVLISFIIVLYGYISLLDFFFLFLVVLVGCFGWLVFLVVLFQSNLNFIYLIVPFFLFLYSFSRQGWQWKYLRRNISFLFMRGVWIIYVSLFFMFDLINCFH